MTRPDVLCGNTLRIETGCGWLYLIVNRNEENKIIEIFPILGKAGGCPSCFLNGMGVILSYSLRNEIPIERVIKAFKGQRCHNQFGYGKNLVLSCLDGIAILLEKELENERRKSEVQQIQGDSENDNGWSEGEADVEKCD